MSPMSVFSILVENRINCFIVCAVHLDLILLAETKYLYTSEAESDFFFISLRRRYRKHCVKQKKSSSRKVHQNFLFTIFNE